MALVLAAIAAGCNPPAPAPPPKSEEQPQRLATATIQVGGRPLAVEVAKTRAEQQKGMMFRTALGPDEAMLFVFPHETNLSFWMKSTLVDLDLAYIRSDGRVVQVERMKANDLTAVVSLEPARFVLEAPPGWLAAHGVGVGAQVIIPPDVAAPAPDE